MEALSNPRYYMALRYGDYFTQKKLKRFKPNSSIKLHTKIGNGCTKHLHIYYKKITVMVEKIIGYAGNFFYQIIADR